MQKAIQELKKWAILTNKLSDWHYLNLQKFPFIAFENIKEVKIEYDIQKQEGQDPYVRYIISSKGKLGKSNKEIEKRISDCTRWVQTILWSDIKVEFVKKNGKPIVTRRRKQKPRQSSSSSSDTGEVST